jgi:anti-anti-sigma regulatory factor
MMKIQTTSSPDALVIHVQGRLAGIFVPALEQCWKAAAVADPRRAIRLDLKDVTCVDRSGRDLLQALHSRGVEFLPASLGVQDVLDEITGRPVPE